MSDLVTPARQHCGTEMRRQRVASQEIDTGGGVLLNGIDFVEVVGAGAPAGMEQRILLVTFLRADGVAGLGTQNFSVTGGARIGGITVTQVQPETQTRLRLTVSAAGDFSPYRLECHADDSPGTHVANMDPRLSAVTFGFKVECPSDFDCKPAPPPPQAPRKGPPVDYLTRDWAGFRQLMLDRMSATMPGWDERNPADLGVTLVEVLADAADKASWFQDAVQTEAFFDRVRYRQSLARHARLLGYRPGEGSNARAAVAVTAGHDRLAGPVITRGTRFLTRSPQPRAPARPVVVPRDPELFEQMLAEGAIVFEAMEDLADLRVARNEIRLHDWGDDACVLPQGATGATLVGAAADLDLAEGDLLILEERIPLGRTPQDPPDPAYRHLVRIAAAPVAARDPLFGLDLVDVTWHAEDALPFDLPLGDAAGRPMAVARGNVLMVDEGRTVDYALSPGAAGEDAIAVGGQDRTGLGADDGPGRSLRLRLDAREVVRAAPYGTAHRAVAARAATHPVAAPVAQVSLTGDGETWVTTPDLLGSDRFAPHVVIEPGTEDTAAYVRFGDGVLGRRPSDLAGFSARIRQGGGPAGRIGAGALAHVVTGDGSGIAALGNPLPAWGGAPRETRRQVQIAAPQAFRTPRRAVTAADYARVAATHPRVARAYARRRWTGSWHTITLAIDLVGGGRVDAGFAEDLRGFIESQRLAGHDLRIVSPRFVPLDLVFFVCARPEVYAADVSRDLLRLFSDQRLADGSLGLFHPDALDFGGDVALSPLIARAMEVPGVNWISLRDESGAVAGRFGRMDQPGTDYGDAGAIPIAGGEIARLDNDPSRPEMGRVRIIAHGGR